MEAVVGSFVGALEDGDLEGVIKWAGAVREGMEGVEKVARGKMSAARRSKRVFELAKVYSAPAAVMLNTLNGWSVAADDKTRTADVVGILFHLHADVIRWLRILAPAMKYSTRTEIERHAANLCRKCITGQRYKLCIEIADAALQTLIPSTTTDKENTTPPNATLAVPSKTTNDTNTLKTIATLQCARLSSLTELHTTTPITIADHIHILHQLSLYDPSAAAKYASSTRRTLLRLASYLATNNEALCAYRTRMKALELFRFEFDDDDKGDGRGGEYDGRDVAKGGFVDHAHKAGLSLVRSSGMSLTTMVLTELAETQHQAVQVYYRRRSAQKRRRRRQAAPPSPPSASMDIEAGAAWIDSVTMWLSESGDAPSAQNLFDLQVTYLHSIDPDMARLIDAQRMWWTTTSYSWPPIVTSLRTLTQSIDKGGLSGARYALRVCRALEPLRKELCRKDGESTKVDLAVKETVLSFYVTAVVRGLEHIAHIDDNDIKLRLRKAAGAMLEAGRVLCEVHVEHVATGQADASRALQVALRSLETMVLSLVGATDDHAGNTTEDVHQVPGVWRGWIATIMYNAGVVIHSKETHPLLAAVCFVKANKWSMPSNVSMAVKCVCRAVKSYCLAGDVAAAVSVALSSSSSSSSVRRDLAVRRALFQAIVDDVQVDWSWVSDLPLDNLIELVTIVRLNETGVEAVDVRGVLLGEWESRAEPAEEGEEKHCRLDVEISRTYLLRREYSDARCKAMECIAAVKQLGPRGTKVQRLVLAEAYAYKGIIDGDQRPLSLSMEILRSLHMMEEEDGNDDFVRIGNDVADVVSAVAAVLESSISAAKAACVMRDMRVDTEHDHSTWAVRLAEALRLLGLTNCSEAILLSVADTPDVLLERTAHMIAEGHYTQAQAIARNIVIKSSSILRVRALARSAICLDGNGQVRQAARSLLEALKVVLALTRQNAQQLTGSVEVCGIGVNVHRNVSGSSWEILRELYGSLSSLASIEVKLGRVGDARYYLTHAAVVSKYLGAVCFSARARADAAKISALAGQATEAEEAIAEASETLRRWTKSGNDAPLMRASQSHVLLRLGDIHHHHQNYDRAIECYRSAKAELEIRPPSTSFVHEWTKDPSMTPGEAVQVTPTRNREEFLTEGTQLQDRLALQIEEQVAIGMSRSLLARGNVREAADILTDAAEFRARPGVLLASAEVLRRSTAGNFAKEIAAAWKGRAPPKRGKFFEYRKYLAAAEAASEEGSYDQRQARLLRAEVNDNAVERLLHAVGTASTLCIRTSDNEAGDISTMLKGLTLEAPQPLTDILCRQLPSTWCVAGLALDTTQEYLYLWQISHRHGVRSERISLCERSFSSTLESFEGIIANAKKTNISAGSGAMTDAEKKDWWKTRFDLDSALSQLLRELEDGWLGASIDLLLGDHDEAPVVLVADEKLQVFPWEMLPTLVDRKQTVTRVPSVSVLLRLLERREVDEAAMDAIDGSGAYFVLNPGGDLERTQTRFESMFRDEFHWQGASGQEEASRLTSSTLRAHIDASSMFVFCGHGAAESLLPARDVSKLRQPPVSLLIGCSSGRLQSSGIYEATGTALEYLTAGAPSVLGNLWDVTDRDIDRFTDALFQSWAGGESLGRAVLHARNACKMFHLVGAAPVLYGLPSLTLSLRTLPRRLF